MNNTSISKNLFHLLNCPCLAFDTIEEAKDQLKSIVESGHGGYSVAINAEKIIRFRNDYNLRSAINQSIFPIPDGSGAVLGLLFLHNRRSIKLDLPKAVFEVSDERRWKVFVAGATEDVNEAAVVVLKNKYKNIRIIGRLNGFVDETTLLAEVKKNVPDVLLLALGSPKQELIAASLRQQIRTIFIVGCGGALDALVGKVPRAPQFMIDNHLEWLYRLYKNPSRWRRQLQLPKYFIYILAAAVSSRLRQLPRRRK